MLDAARKVLVEVPVPDRAVALIALATVESCGAVETDREQLMPLKCLVALIGPQLDAEVSEEAGFQFREVGAGRHEGPGL